MIKGHSHKDRKYNVVPYDPNWINQFEFWASKIRSIFGNLRIEHIGSTAVPGMAGKSCIDVLVIVEDLELVEDHIKDMKRAGFEYAGQFVMEDSRLFRVIKDNELLANIHFFKNGHSHIKEMIDLRNYLKAHPEEAQNYSDIKVELQEKYPHDYALYRKYKDEYMNELKKRVLAEVKYNRVG